MTNHIYRAAKHHGTYSKQDFSDILEIDNNRRVNAKLYPALWALQQRYRYCEYCYNQACIKQSINGSSMLTEIALPFDIKSFDEWPISNFYDPMIMFEIADASNRKWLLNFIDLNNYLKTLASYLTGIKRRCKKYMGPYNQYVLDVDFSIKKDPKCCRGLDQIELLNDAAINIRTNNGQHHNP